MTYRKQYPTELSFNLKNSTTLEITFSSTKKYNPDLWGIKYLFDRETIKGNRNITLLGEISNTMALRMYFLKSLFPNFVFDTRSQNFSQIAEEIIKNINEHRYLTYDSNNKFDNRGTKDKPESKIEEQLAGNLSQYISDFTNEIRVIRQFPPNIFKDQISDINRVTDKLWIDMLSINKEGSLSPIELKVGDNIPLDLFAQGLDYGVYCYLFNKHINDNWFKFKNINNAVTIYYVGENFHPALVGRGEEKGIISLIKKNELINIVFVQITLDKSRCKIFNSEVIFDSRNI